MKEIRFINSLAFCLLCIIVVSSLSITQVKAADEHDVGISNVIVDYSVTWIRAPSKVNVTIENYGSNDEICSLTVYANWSSPPPAPGPYVIGTSQGINLVAGSVETTSFSWDGGYYAPYGPYTISAVLSPVPGETNTTNNLFVDGTIKVTFPYDSDGNGLINVLDLIRVSQRLGRIPPFDPNPVYPLSYRVDMNNDWKINILDLILVAGHLGGFAP